MEVVTGEGNKRDFWSVYNSISWHGLWLHNYSMVSIFFYVYIITHTWTDTLKVWMSKSRLWIHLSSIHFYSLSSCNYCFLLLYCNDLLTNLAVLRAVCPTPYPLSIPYPRVIFLKLDLVEHTCNSSTWDKVEEKGSGVQG